MNKKIDRAKIIAAGGGHYLRKWGYLDDAKDSQ